MKDGLIRVGAATPKVSVANVPANIAAIEQNIKEAQANGCAVLVFPELSVTAYTCGDLFRSSTLIAAAEDGLRSLMQSTAGCDMLCAVGVPVAFGGSLYNCAAVFMKGKLLGLVTKSYIPNYSEFYEMRHFTPGFDIGELSYAGQKTMIGKDLLFVCENVPDLIVGAEICEDLWIASPPSTRLAQNGATVILNPSSSDEVIGKAEYRRELIKNHSARITSAYIYADSGIGESTTDMVFAGHNLIAENDTLLGESELFKSGVIYADIDLQRLTQERGRMNTWKGQNASEIKKIPFAFEKETIRAFQPRRSFDKFPFVPGGAALDERCGLILTMQAVGLATRLQHIGCENAVIGLSGGLDSTLALLVMARAFDRIGLSRKGIKAISMPCFGTTSRTKSNAELIAGEIGADFREINIEKAVLQHFKDIGHDGHTLDVTYENAQARERTQVLMDLANQVNGIVVGTGDLSELALGFATYNGDHMSMYGVNASIPKTLVRHLVRFEADHSNDALKKALHDILDTPVSPELLPPRDGEIAQKTEDIVGPYELHDFFLYYMLRFGFSPTKIFHMACSAFQEDYGPGVVKKWMRMFYRRFFSQQFKRSCLPDGPKVGSVSLSPRGDYRMPSDASADIWLAEIDGIQTDEVI